MIRTTGAHRWVTTRDPAQVDELLASAVERLIPTALALNHGIRVTRTAPGAYIVETAAEVAVGYTECRHVLVGT